MLNSRKLEAPSDGAGHVLLKARKSESHTKTVSLSYSEQVKSLHSGARDTVLWSTWVYGLGWEDSVIKSEFLGLVQKEIIYPVAK